MFQTNHGDTELPPSPCDKTGRTTAGQYKANAACCTTDQQIFGPNVKTDAQSACTSLKPEMPWAQHSKAAAVDSKVISLHCDSYPICWCTE
jgi:hypothetical protein